QSLLDRALLAACFLTLGRPRFHLLLQRRLLARHLQELLDALVERRSQLLLPFLHLAVPRLLHGVGSLVHLRRRLARLVGAGAHLFLGALRVLSRFAGLRGARRGLGVLETIL